MHVTSRISNIKYYQQFRHKCDQEVVLARKISLLARWEVVLTAKIGLESRHEVVLAVKIGLEGRQEVVLASRRPGRNGAESLEKRKKLRGPIDNYKDI